MEHLPRFIFLGRKQLLYMKTAARLLWAQRWKGLQIPTMKEWMVKQIESAEMIELTALIKEKSNFSTWKQLDVLQEMERMKC